MIQLGYYRLAFALALASAAVPTWAGAGLREPRGEDELDYDLYFGVQFFR